MNTEINNPPLCACSRGQKVKVNYWGVTIKRWNRYIAGYNKSMQGKHHSLETKRKLSNANKGKKLSDETCKKMAISGRNKIFTKKHRQNLSLSQTGKKMIEEAKRKISIAFKGRKLSKEHILKRTIAQMKCRADGYCDAWSDSKYKKDCKKNYCKICGVKLQTIIKSNGYTIPNLLLHHKDLDSKNCCPDNLQTLCIGCHTKLHFKLKKEKRHENNSRRKACCA